MKKEDTGLLQNISLRLRYLISFLLIFLVVVLFSSILYESYRDNNIRYINTSTLDKFTYAAENISYLVQPLDNLASVARLESAIVADESGNATVVSDAQIFAALSQLKSNLTDGIQVLFYIRGSSDIYTDSERMYYSRYEEMMAEEYNLPMSQFYYHLNHETDYALIPVLKPDAQSNAIARVIPLSPETDASSCLLIFLLPEDLIAQELERYMGSLQGDIYIFDHHYNLLYTHFSDSENEERVPFTKLIKQKGIGLQLYDEDHVMLSVSHPERGLNYIMVDTWDSFYHTVQVSLRHFRVCILLLIMILVILFVWVFLFNYMPVRRLMSEISGQNGYAMDQNELALIKDSYDRTVEEVEKLSDQVSNLTPLATQQFLNRWILGQIPSREAFDTLARYSDVSFLHKYFGALYFLPDNLVDAERLLQLLGSFHPTQKTVLTGEVPDENALFMIINYDCTGDETEEILAAAQQVCALLDHNGFRSVRLGIGTPSCTDPLELPESFRKAGAAVQLSRSEQKRICAYTSQIRQADGAYHSLPPMSVSLMIGSIGRGDNVMARRALDEITAHISDSADSLSFFRFYSSNLLNLILKQAEENHIQYAQTDLQPMIVFKSIQEFHGSACAFVDDLCERIRQRHALADTHMRDQLMAYILDHYKDFDMSIQSVAEATGLANAQVTRFLREEMGLNFVQYVSYLRMNEFKRLLVETDRTIAEIVNEIGYSDVSNFLRKFKTAEDMTAGQYRAQFTDNHSQTP